MKGKRVLIVGFARSGQAAARLLLAEGAEVAVTDSKEQLAPELFSEFPGVEFTLGGHPTSLLEGTDLIVKSPGVPRSISLLKVARERAIPVISEVELALSRVSARLVAITGTNGKTTTTTLVGEILEAAGQNPVVAGNIGLPLSSELKGIEPGRLVVAELSSFQLEDSWELGPWISCLLNISEAHLDRHGDIEAYARAKARIFAGQGPHDFAILNADDRRVMKVAEGIPAKKLYFSRKRAVAGAFVKAGNLVLSVDNREERICRVSEIQMRGEHNVENALAASVIAAVAGAPAQAIGSVLKTFRGVPHRLEDAGWADGVLFINDSKATNPKATITALKAMDCPVVLLLGGYDRGISFDELARFAVPRVKAVVAFGETREVIADAFSRHGMADVPVYPSLRDAVVRAYETAESGDVVLLAPACASWDEFSDFEQRGTLFVNLVARLGDRREQA